MEAAHNDPVIFNAVPEGVPPIRVAAATARSSGVVSVALNTHGTRAVQSWWSVAHAGADCAGN